MLPDTAPLFGMLPVLSSPWAPKVSPDNTSSTVAVASELSTSKSQVPVTGAPEASWKV